MMPRRKTVVSAAGQWSSARWVLAALLLVAAGCDVQTYDDAAAAFNGGSAPPPVDPPDPEPPTTSPPDTGTFGPAFSEIQAEVFTPSCASSSCHAGANPAQGLNLEAANSYAELVGIASSQDSNILRVAASDPDNSYLVQKLEGTAATGGQMPPGSSLPQSEIDVIRQWIADGASDDRVQSTRDIRVSSVSPGAGAVLDAAPSRIIAGFERPPDASTINALTFTVTGSGGDGTFGDGNEFAVDAFSIVVPVSNPASAVFELSRADLPADSYRIRLSGNGASYILDHDANRLHGGDFVADFDVLGKQTSGAPVPTAGR